MMVIHIQAVDLCFNIFSFKSVAMEPFAFEADFCDTGYNDKNSVNKALKLPK